MWRWQEKRILTRDDELTATHSASVPPPDERATLQMEACAHGISGSVG